MDTSRRRTPAGARLSFKALRWRPDHTKCGEQNFYPPEKNFKRESQKKIAVKTD